VIVDGEFVLYESNAIVEYLEDAYAGRGEPLFPGDARTRALVRRLIAEADNYFDKATDPVVEEAFSKKPEERDAARLASALEKLAEETALFTRYMRGDFLVGPLSAADFALYPLVAFLDRCALKLPDFDPKSVMTPEFAAWKARVEALPYFDKTYPPHWRK
jgi:glutathione S-transferase